MAWDEPGASPLGDLLATAAAYRQAEPSKPPLLMSDGEYETALNLADGDPDRLDAEARSMGFSGVERIREYGDSDASA